MNKIKTRVEETIIDGENVIPKRIIIEVPMPFDMIQDCYMYYAMDAPSELKILLMEELGKTIDEIILKERPVQIDEAWLKGKLNIVQAKYIDDTATKKIDSLEQEVKRLKNIISEENQRRINASNQSWQMGD